MQQHFGREMDARHLPVSWGSTANTLGELQFLAKDALLVIDDFAPAGATYDAQRAHRDADRVFRNQGNVSGRGRMGADGLLRPVKRPRGLPLSTGEDVPAGASVRARLLVMEVAPHDVDQRRLTASQGDATHGLYSQSMAAYIKWLAHNHAHVEERGARVRDLRERFTTDGVHLRTAQLAAELAAGLEAFLTFATEAGVLSGDEAGALLWGRAFRALAEATSGQQHHQQSHDQASRFVQLLRAAVASGNAHIVSTAGDQPTNPEIWGWRTVGADRRGQGLAVGWLDGEDLYLEPDAAYRVAKEFEGLGQQLTATGSVIHKRLNEAGLLATTDQTRRTLTVRRVLQGSRREVLHVKAAVLFPPC